MGDFNPEVDTLRAQSWKDYKQELKQMKDTLLWMWQDLINKEGKSWARKVVLLIFAVCVLGVAGGLIWRRIFDGLAEHNGPKVWLGILMLGGLMLCQEFAQWGKRTMREHLLDKNTYTLNNVTNNLFYEKSMMQHISEGSLLNEANIKRGFDRVQEIETMFCFQATEVIMNILLPYAFLFGTDWRLGLLITAVLIIHMIWALFLSYRVLKYCVPIEKKWRYLGRYRSERWEKVERVKTNNKAQSEIESMNKYYRETIDQDKTFWIWFIKQISLRASAAHIVFIGFVIFAVCSVLYGDKSIGWLYPVIAWGGRVVDNFWGLSDVEHRINYLTPSVVALKKALTMPSRITMKPNAVKLDRSSPCRVEFQNVSYIFPGTEVPVLHNISFTIEPGEKVAIFGRSGIGKSTLMRLLMRYDDPTSGCILIDGIDLRDIDLGSWLDLIGYIPQDSSIFTGTIESNLRYGCKNDYWNGREEELWELVRLLEIDFGERLVNGLQTPVGRGGTKLSGGQKQRMMIGAAAAKKPKIMLIDEATSSLDSTTERKVQAGLRKVLGPETGAMIITHRISTVRRICNKFIMVNYENGSGATIDGLSENFDELMRDCVPFRELAKDQDIHPHTLQNPAVMV